MTASRLAWRTVAARPARAVLGVAGVAVTGALLFDMLLLSNGLLLSFQDLLERAGYDVRVVSAEGASIARAPVDHAGALASELAALPQIAGVCLVRRARAILTLPRGGPLELVGVSACPRGRGWRIVRGVDLPEASTGMPAAVINRRLAERLRVAPGDTLAARMALGRGPSVLPAVTFRVAGIAEFDLEPGDEYLAGIGLDRLAEIEGNDAVDEADVVLVASRPPASADAAAAAIVRRRPELRTMTNAQVVGQFNQNGFAYFRQISAVLTVVMVAFAFLLITTLLSVSVNQRLTEVAVLRALGIPRFRIASALVWESVWLVGIGGVLSLPAGWGIAGLLDRILRAMPTLPERLHFFVFDPEAVAIHALLLASAAAASSIYPVWVATRLPIASTLRRETL